MALADNLVSYWAFDEASGNMLDSHGSNDLTESAGDTMGATTGVVAGARDFEGGDADYASIADNTDLSAGDTDFTLAGWINLESIIAGARTVLSKWVTTGNQREYQLRANATGASARLHWEVSSDGTAGTIATVTDNTFGAHVVATWYFVVVWHDSVNNQIGISVNDVADTASHSAGVFDGSAAFMFGSRGGAGDSYDGLLDEWGFWRRVLTSAEITELYNAGAGRDYAYITGGGAAGHPAMRRTIGQMFRPMEIGREGALVI